MVSVPANWHDMTNNEKKAWANENGLEYQFNSVGLKQAVDSKQVNDLKKEKQQLQDDLENAKTKLTIISEQSWAEKLEKAGNPVGITTVEGLKAYVDAQAQKNKGDDPVGLGGSGEVDISGNLGNNEEGFENERELVDFLRNKAAIGDIQSKKILNKLFYKTLAGRRENPRMMKEEFSNKINELTGKEQGLIQRLNEDFQAREKLRREQKGE